MKNLLFCLFISTTCYSQDIPKYTNTIVVKGLSFDSAMNLLLDKGFRIEKKDNDLYTFETEPKEASKSSIYIIKLYGRSKDSSIYFTATSDLYGTNAYNHAKVENRGMKGSFLQKSFIAFNNLILSFNKPVEYQISN